MNEELQKKLCSDDDRRNREAEEQSRETNPLEGVTLESDPEYYAVATPGYATPEAQIAAEAEPVDVDQRRMEEDNFDPLSGRALEERSEPLKTRLPGDTSSEPHTDLGPDEATNLQKPETVQNSGKLNRR